MDKISNSSLTLVLSGTATVSILLVSLENFSIPPWNVTVIIIKAPPQKFIRIIINEYAYILKTFYNFFVYPSTISNFLLGLNKTIKNLDKY